MARDGRTEAEATDWLAARALNSEEVARYNERRGAAALANDVARKWYHTQFIESENAVSWWEHRGYTLDRAKVEMIGLAPPDARVFLDAMKGAYVSRGALIDAGLVMPGRNAGTVTVRFRSRLLFPITDDRDISTIAFTGRVLDSGQDNTQRPKYLNTGVSLLWEKRRTLYGLGQARSAVTKSRIVHLVEGQFGVLRCAVSGIKNVVASSGTSFTPAQASLLAGIARGEKPRAEIRLVVCYDEGAEKMAREAARVALVAGFAVDIVTMPSGSDDPDGYGRAHGAAALISLMGSATDALESVYRSATGCVAGDISRVPLRARLHAADEVRDYILAASSTKVRKASAAAAATWYGITADELIGGTHAP
ncbi:MAG: toprim domain-containing protein [Gemmatimonadaceae bacterium]